MNALITLVAFTYAAITFFMVGWAGAHSTVATECIRQGSFYVNDKDFECKPKEGHQ